MSGKEDKGNTLSREAPPLPRLNLELDLSTWRADVQDCSSLATDGTLENHPMGSKPRVFLQCFKFRERLQISPSDANGSLLSPARHSPAAQRLLFSSSSLVMQQGKLRSHFLSLAPKGPGQVVGCPWPGTHSSSHIHTLVLRSSHPSCPACDCRVSVDNGKYSRGSSWQSLAGRQAVWHRQRGPRAEDQTPYFSSTPGVISSVGNSKWATKRTLKGCPLPSSPSARLS